MSPELRAAARHVTHQYRRALAVAQMPPRKDRPGPIRQTVTRQAPMWSRAPRRGPMAWRAEGGERR